MEELKNAENSKFEKIRKVVIDGETWYVGKDVTEALGYSNSRSVLRKHVSEEDKIVGRKNATPSIIDSMGRVQYPTWINASGFYSLIMCSKLPSAKKYKDLLKNKILSKNDKESDIMNNLKIFENTEFGKIRVIMIDDEPWFVGRDVSLALGYAKPQNAISIHVDEEDKTTALIQSTGSNYKSKAVIINESGLYSLILNSKLESAKCFKHWVISEVLPSLRKTGIYIDGEQFSSVLEKMKEQLDRIERNMAQKSDLNIDGGLRENFQINCPADENERRNTISNLITEVSSLNNIEKMAAFNFLYKELEYLYNTSLNDYKKSLENETGIGISMINVVCHFASLYKTAIIILKIAIKQAAKSRLRKTY